MISDKKPVRDFVNLLISHGIRHVIITPGSRNAPFIISLHDHAEILSYSIVDERSAGFVALGMAQQLGKPVVLICTSGTAALNYAPALAEAYYQRVPLLVVTADRPIEWIDQGEGQSIRQREVFRNYVKASYEIAEEASEGDLVWYNVRIMDEAMRLCAEGVQGPVHINFPLRESLYRAIEEPAYEMKMIARAETVLQLSDKEKANLNAKLDASKKVMVLAGQMKKDSDLTASLIQFAQRPNVVVFTEAHSNIAHPDFISSIDRLIMGFDDEQKSFIVPDVLITVGHNIISRKVKEYLRKGITEHWHVDISNDGLDTLKHLRKIIPLSPADFFRSLAKADGKTPNTEYKAKLLAWNNQARISANEYYTQVPWSDLKVFHSICSAIPANSDVQMGNSSVVRYILLSDAREDLTYFGNRGVAGIDGCTSTAVGASYITGKLTTLISGDIGFLYDSNAFWNDMIQPNLKIIVINNGGGGIFRIIEGPSSTGEALEKFFETKHQRKAKSIALMYDIHYREASNETELEEGLNWLYQTDSCSILEVNTPGEANNDALKGLFKHVKLNILQNKN